VYQDLDSNSSFRAANTDKGGHLVKVHITWESTDAAPSAPAADASGVIN